MMLHRIYTTCYYCVFISGLSQVVHGVHLGPAHLIRKRSLDNPLRILLYYDESVYRYVMTMTDLLLRLSKWVSHQLELYVEFCENKVSFRGHPL